MDGLHLPSKKPTVWEAGSVQEVAFALLANHGGGYSWRLCKNEGLVNEECFQRTPMRFVSNVSEVQYGDKLVWETPLVLPRFQIPLVKTSDGTHPPASEWARIPIPGCKVCDQSSCGAALFPNMTEDCKPGGIYGDEVVKGGCDWIHQQWCNQRCSGFNLTACPPGMVQFPEPLSSLSGYSGDITVATQEGFTYSIIDKVQVPSGLEPGAYLLSWRWDCEQSHQIWQNCADITIVKEELTEATVAAA